MRLAIAYQNQVVCIAPVFNSHDVRRHLEHTISVYGFPVSSFHSDNPATFTLPRNIYPRGRFSVSNPAGDKFLAMIGH